MYKPSPLYILSTDNYTIQHKCNKWYCYYKVILRFRRFFPFPFFLHTLYIKCWTKCYISFIFSAAWSWLFVVSPLPMIDVEERERELKWLIHKIFIPFQRITWPQTNAIIHSRFSSISSAPGESIRIASILTLHNLSPSHWEGMIFTGYMQTNVAFLFFYLFFSRGIVLLSS